jgi:hypothetical protein
VDNGGVARIEETLKIDQESGIGTDIIPEGAISIVDHYI